MVRALSAAERAARESTAKEEAYRHAESLYRKSHLAHKTSIDPNQTPPVSLRNIVACYRGLINVTTLSRRLNRLPSQAEDAHRRTKLTTEEEDVIVQHIWDQGALGFPCGHRTVLEVGNSILSARHERERTKFQPLGNGWSAQFVVRHSLKIKTYWSKSLHSSRANAVNPAIINGWNQLKAAVQHGDFTNGNAILAKNICNMDETGWNPSIRQTQCVLGPAGNKIQYKIEDGICENITVISDIMADGTYN